MELWIVLKYFPILKDIVLLGGGHAHVLVLKRFAMKPWPGVRLTLVSSSSLAPYSGMLPALLSGVLSEEEAHIDLRQLCEHSGARFVQGHASGLDLEAQQVLFEARPPLGYDLLSINIGSQPSFLEDTEQSGDTIGVKPVGPFLQRLRELETSPKQLCVLGGGLAGTELVLGLERRFRDLGVECSLHEKRHKLLPELPSAARRFLVGKLRKRNIKIFTSSTGPSEATDALRVLCTSAQAAPWLAECGLKTDPRGFVLVNSCLQSLSHSNVFAVGDAGHVAGEARPKAGVYAVRQGKPLAENLQRAAKGQKLKPYKAQSNHLVLIGSGDEEAVGVKGRWVFSGRWVFRFKQAIDKAFMDKLNILAPMKEPGVAPKADTQELLELEKKSKMRCLGCGSKWGGDVLKRILERLSKDDFVKASAEDAAVFTVSPGKASVQTIDYMPALVSDPYVFGRILFNHAMNDIYAMGATPTSAQVLLELPFSASSIAVEDGFQVLSAFRQEAKALKHFKILGGHTAEGEKLACALVCNGEVDPAKVWTKKGLQKGDALVLTKALGTGILFAAAMKLQVKATHIDRAIKSMLQTHAGLGQILEGFTVHAATDISGFGLLGHLSEMVEASDLEITLDTGAINLLPGTQSCIEKGIRPSLFESNKVYAAAFQGQFEAPEHAALYDPQTSGPMLIALPQEEAENLAKALQKAGFEDSAVVGSIS